MRLSTLTVIVFAAHATTQVIAAPVPFPGDVQELEIRGNNDPPASSSGPPVSSTNWAGMLSSGARMLPQQVINTSVPSKGFSVAQQIAKAAVHAGPAPSSRVIPPAASRFKLGQPQSQIPKPRPNNPILDMWKERDPGAFLHPGAPKAGSSRILEALALEQPRRAPVTTASHQAQGSHPAPALRRAASSPELRNPPARPQPRRSSTFKRSFGIDELD